MNAVPYAGIALALVATTAYNLGLILEKRALGRCRRSTSAGCRAWSPAC